jgi:beta-xylosidase
MNSKHFFSFVLFFFILSLTACGGGEPPATLPPVLPVDTLAPTNTLEPPRTYDGFDGAFVLPWTWKDENPAKWNLTENPGFLRIYTSPYPDGGQNILLMPVTGNFTATTHVLFEPTTNFQFAGLTLFVENGIKVTFGRAFCGFIPPCVGNGLYFDYIEEEAAINGNFATAVPATNEAWLKLERVGDALTGSYSGDGSTWQVIGTHTLSAFFASPRIGLITGNDMVKDDPEIHADFDFFDLVITP